MQNLADLLMEVLAKTSVPSVAAAAVVDGKLHAAGAVGVRKRGDATPVTVDDKYHIGSCAKAMTATLAGILVERGVLGWDSSIKDVFPEIHVHADYESVTLEQLLSHTAGFPAYTDPHKHNYAEDSALWAAERPAAELRREVVLPTVLARPPETTPGTIFEYSNMGYCTVGAMVEQATGTPFEILLQTELFRPLGMTTVGFGAPGTSGRTDEPYGHAPDPVEPGPDADNLPILSPVGTVHMSVLDFAKHAAFHLTGEPRLFSRETLEFLHTPVLDNYALGWGVVERDWAPGKLLTHAGSNGRSFALHLLAPALGFAAVIACNSGTEEGPKVMNETLQAIKRTFLNVN